MDQVEVRRKALGEQAEAVAVEIGGVVQTGVEVGRRKEAAGSGCVFEAEPIGPLWSWISKN